MGDIMPTFQIKILDKRGKIPTRTRNTDAGWDLHAIEYACLDYHEVTIVRFGIAIAAPPGYYYTIESRSGLSRKGIIVMRNIIDSSYTGELCAVIKPMLPDQSYNIMEGDRVAQLIPHEIIDIDLVKVSEFSPEYNVRGDSGWGDSGR